MGIDRGRTPCLPCKVGKYLENIWKIFGKYLENILENIWKIFWKIFEWVLIGGELLACLAQLGNIWRIFGKYFGKYLENI